MVEAVVEAVVEDGAVWLGVMLDVMGSGCTEVGGGDFCNERRHAFVLVLCLLNTRRSDLTTRGVRMLFALCMLQACRDDG